LSLQGCTARIDDRPNIVVIIADDQSSKSLSPAAPPWLETPNIDRLAAEGVRFSNSFVTTSLCSPARASFLTGQYVRKHGIVDNVQPFPEQLVTFASELTRAGYDSAYLGKWHMGSQAGRRPGFSYSASFVGQGVYRDARFYVDDHERATVGYVDEVSTRFALEFLDRPRDGPFLLVLGFKAPHGPTTPPRHLSSRYGGSASHRRRTSWRGRPFPGGSSRSCWPKRPVYHPRNSFRPMTGPAASTAVPSISPRRNWR
jgi:arylsulfatase A-like enzyme